MLLILLLALKLTAFGQLLEPEPQEQEFRKILSSFGNDYIRSVQTKYEQLFTNFHSETLGRKIVFYASNDISACGYASSDKTKVLASIEYGESSKKNYRKEQVSFVGCNMTSNFTFVLQRNGESLKRLKPEKLIEELEFLDLKPQENRRVISFILNGVRQYTIQIKRKDSSNISYTYEFDGTIILNANKYENDQVIKIEFYYPNLNSPLGENLKRLWAQYNKQTKETRYRWPNSNLNLSQRQFDSYVQQIIRSAISFFYASLHEHSLLLLPETKVVATATSDSEFYRKLIEMLAILSSGQINPVVDFLNQTKADIESGVLVVTEN